MIINCLLMHIQNRLTRYTVLHIDGWPPEAVLTSHIQACRWLVTVCLGDKPSVSVLACDLGGDDNYFHYLWNPYCPNTNSPICLYNTFVYNRTVSFFILSSRHIVYVLTRTNNDSFILYFYNIYLIIEKILHILLDTFNQKY